jgi:hypothetical protein
VWSCLQLYDCWLVPSLLTTFILMTLLSTTVPIAWLTTHENWVSRNRDPSTSWILVAFIPLLTKHTIVSRRLSSTDAILRMAEALTHYGCLLHNILSMFYAGGCSTSTTVTSGNKIILMLSANVGINSTSALKFALKLSRTLLQAPVCCVRAWVQNNIALFCKLFYHGCLKIYL